MTIPRDAVQQERADEAQLDNELAAAAEKAAAVIQECNQTIAQQQQRIEDLESRDAEITGVVLEGSAARTERMARKRRVLEMLRNAGVVAAVLLVAFLVYRYPNSFGHQPVQVAAQTQLEPQTPGSPPAGFTTRSAA